MANVEVSAERVPKLYEWNCIPFEKPTISGPKRGVLQRQLAHSLIFPIGGIASLRKDGRGRKGEFEHVVCKL